MGRIAGIARRDKSRAPMQTLETAQITDATGVANDFRGKSRNRTVTLLSADVWKAVCHELGQEMPWTTRRSNLLIEGMELPQRAGDQIHVGDVRLQVTTEVNPCSRMDEQYDGLTTALTPDWRGGVGCVVLQGGTVSVGDAVLLVSGLP